MTAECEAQPQNSPQALNMRLLGTAHSSDPFGGCAMAVRELGQPPYNMVCRLQTSVT
jgi:hypothetical protein